MQYDVIHIMYVWFHFQGAITSGSRVIFIWPSWDEKNNILKYKKNTIGMGWYVPVKACGRAIEHRSSTAMLKHAVEWSSTDQAQPLELLSVMTSTEGAQ